MGRLTPSNHPDLIVGAASGDDAAVWRLSDERALIATADFITPVVDDARTWGRVAAANAVSDVYAMGGSPLLALNLVGWNIDVLGAELLGDVLLGGQDIAEAAGFVIAGGHTIDDPEPKYGMAVIGEVHPDRLLTNAGLRAGDYLVLSKPLGIGVITTGIKRAMADAEVVSAALESMTRLNDIAARIASEAGATGATDVTGFGFLGHTGRMAAESHVDITVTVADVPMLAGAETSQRLERSLAARVGTSTGSDPISMSVTTASSMSPCSPMPRRPGGSCSELHRSRRHAMPFPNSSLRGTPPRSLESQKREPVRSACADTVWPMTTHTVVVFDLGNVLIGWDRALLFSKLIDDADELEHFLSEVYSLEANQELDRGVPLADVVAALSARHPEYQTVLEAFGHRWIETIAGAIDGSVEILEELHTRWTPLYALSNWGAETFAIVEHEFLVFRALRRIGDLGP